MNILLQVIDYIFYRLYLTYKKANEGPVFSTIFVFAIFIMFYISIPIAMLFSYFLKNDIVFVIIFLTINIFGILAIIRRYNGEKIEAILTKYKFNKWNNQIKTWVIFMIIFFVISAGILMGFILGSYLVLGVRTIGGFF